MHGRHPMACVSVVRSHPCVATPLRLQVLADPCSARLRGALPVSAVPRGRSGPFLHSCPSHSSTRVHGHGSDPSALSPCPAPLSPSSLPSASASFCFSALLPVAYEPRTRGGKGQRRRAAHTTRTQRCNCTHSRSKHGAGKSRQWRTRADAADAVRRSQTPVFALCGQRGAGRTASVTHDCCSMWPCMRMCPACIDHGVVADSRDP